MNMLQQAAGLVESRSHGASDSAQVLSRQLSAAQSRIESLEADLRHYQDRVDRAEQWLHRIYSEIEAKFPQVGGHNG